MAILIQSDQEWQLVCKRALSENRGIVAMFCACDDSDLQERQQFVQHAIESKAPVWVAVLPVENVINAVNVEQIQSVPSYRGYDVQGKVYGIGSFDPESLSRLIETVDPSKMTETTIDLTSGVIEIDNDAKWQELQSALKSTGRPCIVQFSADWCGPCKRMYPVMNQLVAAHGAQITFARVNIDGAQQTARNFGVSSVPNFQAIDASQNVVETTVGANSAKLQALVTRLIQ